MTITNLCLLLRLGRGRARGGAGPGRRGLSAIHQRSTNDLCPRLLLVSDTGYILLLINKASDSLTFFEYL